MSYNIYKTIRVNDDLTISGITAESNLFTYDGKHIFNEFKSNYIVKNYPTATKEQAKILWLFESAYCGDKYYNNWGDDLKLVFDFFRDKGEEDWHKYFNIDGARECLEYIKTRKNARSKYYVIIGGEYVYKHSTRRVWRTYAKELAKVFKGTKDELLSKFAGYRRYNLELEEV